MTRFLKHCSFPYVSSTLVATLISLAATVLVVPVIVTPQPEQSSTLSHDIPRQSFLSSVADTCWRRLGSLVASIAADVTLPQTGGSRR
jgi:predicted PurR-regulated permease PerM